MYCADCYGKPKLCNACIDRHILSHPEPQSRRLVAKAAKRDIFPATCPIHGVDVPFGVKSYQCVACAPDAGPPRAISRSLRAQARADGLDTYAGSCATCGPAQLHVTCGKCATCWTAGGVRRQRERKSARALARRTGVDTYAGDCAECGPAQFHVASGKCFRCWTANGSRRKQPTIRDPMLIARTAMARAGLSVDEIEAILCS